MFKRRPVFGAYLTSVIIFVLRAACNHYPFRGICAVFRLILNVETERHDVALFAVIAYIIFKLEEVVVRARCKRASGIFAVFDKLHNVCLRKGIVRYILLFHRIARKFNYRVFRLFFANAVCCLIRVKYLVICVIVKCKGFAVFRRIYRIGIERLYNSATLSGILRTRQVFKFYIIYAFRTRFVIRWCASLDNIPVAFFCYIGGKRLFKRTALVI